MQEETKTGTVNSGVDSSSVVNSSSVIDIKSLSVTARQESFMDEYRKLAAKWGVDFQPAFQVVDLFAISKEGTLLEGVKDEKKGE